MDTSEDREPPVKDRGLRLVPVLLALTVVSGLIDAVSYLGFGHVFTANMTGNVVLLGFVAAGAPGFSVPHTLTSLGSFVVGAAAGGRTPYGSAAAHSAPGHGSRSPPRRSCWARRRRSPSPRPTPPRPPTP